MKNFSITEDITGDHFHDKGGLMISYRYILKNMSGNLNGNSEVEIDDIFDNYNSISESNKIKSHEVGFQCHPSSSSLQRSHLLAVTATASFFTDL